MHLDIWIILFVEINEKGGFLAIGIHRISNAPGFICSYHIYQGFFDQDQLRHQ